MKSTKASNQLDNLRVRIGSDVVVYNAPAMVDPAEYVRHVRPVHGNMCERHTAHLRSNPHRDSLHDFVIQIMSYILIVAIRSCVKIDEKCFDRLGNNSRDVAIFGKRNIIEIIKVCSGYFSGMTDMVLSAHGMLPLSCLFAVVRLLAVS